MPQMNKGGKFIFGKSLIRTDGTLRIPPQAMEEYHIADEGKVYLFTGSKITGGFCVTRKGLLHPSKLGHILDDTPPLLDYAVATSRLRWELKDRYWKKQKTMMVKFRFFKCNNLNLWRITIVDKAVIYIHGKGGNAEEAIHYKPLFSNCDVIGLDYTAQFPWEAKEEFPLLFNSIYRNYKTVEVIANSIGAYFAINALSNQQIEKAYFISPVVDMERLIADMMIWANVTEDELKEKKEIQTTFGETLSWDYLCYARENPIIWEIPTHILYGEKDNLTAYGTIFEFVQRTNSTLSIMKNGEHWFHTDEQMKFLDEWIIKSSK